MVNINNTALAIGPNFTTAKIVEVSKNPLPKQKYDVIQIDAFDNKLNSGLATVDSCQTAIEVNLEHPLRADSDFIDGELALFASMGFGPKKSLQGINELNEATNSIVKQYAKVFEDGTEIDIYDTITDASIDLTVGQVAKVIGKMTGFIQEIKQGTITPATFNNPYLIVGCATIATIDGNSIDAQKIVISPNPTITTRYLMGKGKTQDITKLGFTIDVTLSPKAYTDYLQDMKDQNQLSMKVYLNADGSGKPVKDQTTVIMADEIVPVDIVDSDDKGSLSRVVRFALYANQATPAIRLVRGDVGAL